MPRYFFISDLHGNLTGLEAVLRFMDAHGPFNGFYVLGDLLGGGSGAGEVLDLLVQRNAILLRGNHEEMQLDLEACLPRIPPQWLELMKQINVWLAARLAPRHWELLRSLPLEVTVEASPGRCFYACHTSPADTWAFSARPDTPAATLDAMFGKIDADVILFGHHHEHLVMQYRGKLLVNVASVGLRSDGLAACTILAFENERWAVQQYQVPYDQALEDSRVAAGQVPRPVSSGGTIPVVVSPSTNTTNSSPSQQADPG